jgi:hypothetical protein
LHDAGSDAKGARKCHQESVNNNAEKDQCSAVVSLLDRWGVLICLLCVSISSSECSATSLTTRSIQPSISTATAIKNQQDIHKCHNALLEFAIADFFHSENIPGRLVESSRFQLLLKVALLVGDDFVSPN